MILKASQQIEFVLAIALFAFLVSFACNGKTNQTITNDIKSTKESLLEADKAFSELSVTKGATAAFDSFLAEDATIFRNHADPYVGRQAIHNLQSQGSDQGTLTWQPYFADAASSGEFGYTLGKWQYSETDSAGKPQSVNGYYVTIWKKQHEGKWKFVFDSGVTGPPPAEK